MLRKSKVPLTWLGTALIVASISMPGCGIYGGGGGQTEDPDPTCGAPRAVTLRMTAFNPGSLTICPGDTVTWTHADGGTPHTITSGNNGATDAGSVFDFGSFANPLSDGDTRSHTFDDAGTFPYHCRFHGGGSPPMIGTITVSN